ncbi:hypothetical protein [Edaphobacter aggregans]|uniref:hypothetical protein n=1 Tax=Edaphobacter aggregans TaxID=570835 RepID=UPI000551C9DC|nr:hypothetical protein [Edaphobacter aggregans]
MEMQNDNMRERLLARLPQPENLAAYREETAALLAKHEKALFWEKMASTASYVIVAIMVALRFWGQTSTEAMRQYFLPLAGFVYFLGATQDLRYRIYRSKVDTLKEVKQVQLQILEIQASLQKRS